MTGPKETAAQMPSAVRLRSLDIARGVTIVTMIIANAAGMIAMTIPGGTSYAPLLHADWEGCTIADLVFPFFLFFVGVAIPIAADGSRQPTRPLRLARRTTLLILLGLGVNYLALIGGDGSNTLRACGVLQRIGVAYLLSALLYFRVSAVGRAGLVSVGLTGYAALLLLAPFPGIGPADLWRKNYNFSSWFDMWILGTANMVPAIDGVPASDPETLLGIIPTTAIVLTGTIAGDRIRIAQNHMRLVATLVVTGAFLAAMGWFAADYIPMVKKLWTPSFVLFTTGLALVFTATTYGIVEIYQRVGKAGRALEAFGRNSIAAYLLHIMALAVLVGLDGTYLSLAAFSSPSVASLPLIATAVVLTFLPIRHMYIANRVLRL